MQAIVQTGYGGTEQLELLDVDVPELAPDQFLVRVHAASINAGDWRLLRGRPFLARRMMGGFRRPAQGVRGTDASGVVEAVGAEVDAFSVGDEVLGGVPGAFAELAAARERSFVRKPAQLTFEEAAAIPVAGATALQALRDHGRLQPGDRVLVNGAAGGVGMFAVQLAKALGASHVAAVCSTRNVELVRSLGADDVVDYTRDDFTRRGERYDLVLDIVGNRSLRALRRVRADGGRIVLAGGESLLLIANGFLRGRLGADDVTFFTAKLAADDIAAVAQLVAAGDVKVVVDRTVTLREVPDAVGRLASGHGRAKTVVVVG